MRTEVRWLSKIANRGRYVLHVIGGGALARAGFSMLPRFSFFEALSARVLALFPLGFCVHGNISRPYRSAYKKNLNSHSQLQYSIRQGDGMWLINNLSLRLEFFPSPDDVPYAILSHTWGIEEVNFQDMRDLSHARQKAGWFKIEKTCDIAREDGYRYTWIDTCCIDKTSSAELSEAINSMFLWYVKSATCYAYLSDLPAVPKDILEDWTRHDLIKGYLERCRWFTRGWTLQELVAPKNILFYNTSWDFVAGKQFLIPILAQITGVDNIVLNNIENLPDIPIGRRISWAARRETTRVEDLAYCLLGILDVNMPPLYGEGSKAFIRLQEEIAKTSNDLTLFAWRQSSVDSLLYRYSGIFAHSPQEFNCCAYLRTQATRFDVESEFTLTNRGLRVEQNLFRPPEPLQGAEHHLNDDETLVLSLDCMECSKRTDFKPKWVGIYLRKIGTTYIRTSPNSFYYFLSRSDARRQQALADGRRAIAYICRTLTHKNIRDLQDKTTVSVICHDRSDLSCQETEDQLPVTRVFQIPTPRNYIMTLSFPAAIRTTAIDSRPAIVFGFQGPSNELWSMPYLENELGVSEHSEDHSNKLRAVRDYVFEKYSDPSGRLDTKRMPNIIKIRDERSPSSFYGFSVEIQQDSTDGKESQPRNHASHAVISFSSTRILNETT